jgi:hypothetical protein
MPRSAPPPQPAPEDLGDRLEFVLDPAGPKSNVVPLLARLLRRLRDRARTQAEEGGAAKAG